MNPERVLVAGDTHADIDWIDYLIRIAGESGINTILQLGDTGYLWGNDFIDHVSVSLFDNLGPDAAMVWVDGNHDDHVYIRKEFSKRPNAEGFWECNTDNILYAPRGHRWTWQDKVFVAMGGAYSIDRNYRRVGSSFWFEETITADEANLGIKGGKCDVLVSHDCPADVQILDPNGYPAFKDTYPESYRNRQILSTVVDATHPELIMHGHYHVRHTSEYSYRDSTQPAVVQGFGCNWDRPGGYGILDVRTLTFES